MGLIPFKHLYIHRVRGVCRTAIIKIYWHTEFTEYRTHIVCARLAHAKTQRKDERLKMNVERLKMNVER